MLGKLGSAFVAFSMGTTLTLIILGLYALGSGRLNSDNTTQIIALLNGIDISGQRLQAILNETEDREQPDFDEILEARKLDSFDVEMKLQSQQAFRDEISAKWNELQTERDHLDDRLTAFRSELEEIRKGAQEKGIQDVQRMLKGLEAAQAKEQLLIMYEDERIDDVVTIIQGMSSEKRNDIMATFTSEKEIENLAEIFRRIADGQPTTSLIDKANAQ